MSEDHLQDVYCMWLNAVVLIYLLLLAQDNSPEGFIHWFMLLNCLIDRILTFIIGYWRLMIIFCTTKVVKHRPTYLYIALIITNETGGIGKICDVTSKIM